MNLNFKTLCPNHLQCIISARVVSVITITYKVGKSKQTNKHHHINKKFDVVEYIGTCLFVCLDFPTLCVIVITDTTLAEMIHYRRGRCEDEI